MLALDNTHSNAKPSHSGNLTEIVLPKSDSSAEFVMPMLAQLSRQAKDKWFTWITDQPIDKKALINSGFSCKNVRVIYSKSVSDSIWIFWEALRNGTSSSVVVTLDKLKESEINEFEQAAQLGNSTGLVLRYR